MSIAANVAITGRLIACIDNHIWYLHDAFSPRHVSRSVLYRPAQLCCQHSAAISCRPASALCICMQRTVPGCQYARCSYSVLLLLLLIRSSWQKSLQDKMVKANISQVNFEVFRIIKYFADKARADQTQLWCEHIGCGALIVAGRGVTCHQWAVSPHLLPVSLLSPPPAPGPNCARLS